MSAATDIPADWQQVSLRELHAGGTGSLDPREFPEERFEYYSIPAYQEAGKPLVVLGCEIQSQKLLIPDSCLLFGKLNPRVEKVWNIKSVAPLRRLASTEWLPIVPVEVLDQDFGYYLLRSEWVMPIAKGLVSGSTPSRERVEPKAFYDIVVPLPPKAEQKSIAGILSLLDRSIYKQSELLEELSELKRAAMRELFTRGLRGEPQKDTEIGPMPESWELATIGAHHTVVSGGTPSRGNTAFWSGGTIPWVKTTEVDYCVITETEEHITPLGLESSAAKMLPVGTLLMAMYGQGVTRGKVAILGIEAACNQACAAIMPKDEAVLPRYLYHFLAWRYDAIRSLAHGGQQQNLNLEIVRDLPVVYPQAHDEQKEIVAILDAIDRKIDLHRQKRRVLEGLFKALLHKLMTGEVRVTDLDLSALEPLHTPHVAA